MRSSVVLRWVFAIVLMIQTIPAFHAGHAGAPFIAGAEVLGIVLFVIPKTARIGAVLLLVVFAVVAAIHLHLGDRPLYLVHPALVVLLLERKP